MVARRHFGVGAAVLLLLTSASAFVGRPGGEHVCPQRWRARQHGSDVCVLSENLTLGKSCHRHRHSNVALFAKPQTSDDKSEERAKLLDERKEQLRVLLSASKEDIDKLVRNNPSVLKCSDIEKVHGPKLKLLQERLGITKKAAGQLCASRNRLLGISLATLEKKMDWLQTRLNLNKTQLRKIIERNPDALTSSIDGNLQLTVDNIQSSLELSDEELNKLVERTPEVLTQCADNITQRISLLQEILDLPEDDIEVLWKKIKKAPRVLFWPEERMKENQQWIQERFSLGDEEIAHMCRTHANLLLQNSTTMNKKADAIQSDLSLSDDELSGLVRKYPSILCFSIENNLRPRLRYFRTIFQLDDDALKHLLLKQVPLFGLSEGNIEEKLTFYSSLVGEREAKRLVVKSSNLLLRSLKKLKSRLEEVEKSGVKIRWDETRIQRLACRSDDLWERYKLGEARKPRKKEL